jgi:hypothetical protein
MMTTPLVIAQLRPLLSTGSFDHSKPLPDAVLDALE